MPTDYTDEVGVLMREIKYSIKTLDELINEKQDLIGLMSHDLKNPLNAVITYAELIESTGNEIGSKIKDAALIQKDIINSVLEMLEQESIIVTESMKEEFDLKDQIDELLKVYETQLNNKSITVISNFNNTKVFGNKNLLNQVFGNIFSNAIKFTPQNGEIRIDAEILNGKTKINFIDSGIGFDPDNAPKLFERFTKYKRKGTNNEPTTGLGLYLCNKIIDRHSGSIEAKSEGKDKGSSFEITLPIS